MAALLAAACGGGGAPEPSPRAAASRPAEKLYPFKGRIVDVDRERKQAEILHDEIPGYMAAMQMVYPIKDENALLELAPGAEISATLVVVGSEYWLKDLVIGKQAPAGKASPRAPAAEPKRGARVPDVTLVDQDGKSIRISDLRGKAVALTFIFTRCPLPEFCPRVSQSFARVQEQLAQDPELLKRTELLSISFDTGFDTPKTLHAFGARYQSPAAGPPFAHWKFLTGRPEAIKALGAFFGLEYVEEAGQFTHNLRAGVIDAEGRLVSVRRGSDWDAAGVVGELAQAVSGLTTRAMGSL